MTVTMELVGDKEFSIALDGWTQDLYAQTVAALDQTGRELAVQLKEAYPKVTGNLRKGVKVSKDRQSNFLSIRVRTTAPHAHLYELGTGLRRHRNGKSVGRMPANPTFVPLCIRYRNRFNAEVRRLLRRPVPAIGSGVPDVVETSGNSGVPVFSGRAA